MTRKKAVGDLGEGLIVRLLECAGVDPNSIRDLNQRRYNHAGGDFLAKRAAIEYFISVKTRNKYKFDVQGRRRLNGGYNLYPQKVRRAARAYNAVPAWVPMTPTAVADYECLANDEFCSGITPELSNQLPEHRAGLYSSQHGPTTPGSRLLKKGEFVRQKDVFRHALATQAKNIREAGRRRRMARHPTPKINP
jgi:hypothetical protein